MEKIRLSTHWILWCVFLFWACTPTVRTLDGSDRISTRKQKLEALLRVLKTYPNTAEQNSKLEKTFNNQSSVMSPRALEYDVVTTLPSDPESGITEETAQIPPPITSYEDFYRVEYGTEEGIKRLKKNYGPDGLRRARARFPSVSKEIEDVKKANEHFLRIRTRARCKTPVPRLIRVKDYYPDPSREYLPRCTLLHRCGETAGCCDSDAYHCVPSAVQEVALHFYKLTVGRNGLGYKGSKNNIERLLFVNHTSCHCQPINDLPRLVSADHRPYPLDGMAPEGDNRPSTKRSTPHRRRHHQAHNNSKCRECPVPFNSRTYRDGRCGCDCFDRQKPCLRIKRGKQPLSEIERRCVESKHCHEPACEHGVFDASTGYCPRRHDQPLLDHAVMRHRLQDGARTRWSYLERQ